MKNSYKEDFILAGNMTQKMSTKISHHEVKWIMWASIRLLTHCSFKKKVTSLFMLPHGDVDDVISSSPVVVFTKFLMDLQ